MNRRGFIQQMLKAAVGFSILPPATTYSRIWRAQREPPRIYWDQSQCAGRYLSEDYKKAVWGIDWEEIRIGIGTVPGPIDTSYQCHLIEQVDDAVIDGQLVRMDRTLYQSPFLKSC